MIRYESRYLPPEAYYELDEDELMHFGIKGMKWGVRRFQNPDGTYTALGLKRLRKETNLMNKVARYTESGKEKKAIKYQKKLERFNRKNAKLDKKIERYDKKKKAANDRDFMTRKDAKDASKLSDDELRRRKERLDLENAYKQSMKNARGGGEKKEGTVKGLAKMTGNEFFKTALSVAAKGAGMYAAKVAVSKALKSMPEYMDFKEMAGKTDKEQWEAAQKRFQEMFPKKKN